MSSFRYTRPDSFPPIVKNLIIINVLLFSPQTLFDNQFHITEKFSLQPIISDHLKDVLVRVDPEGKVFLHPHFSPYQIFTHMFTHGNFWHILFNMFVLWMFGRVLESVWGSKRF